ncbi:MAG: hypothetical protein PVH77_02255 [Phycisphaerales bacterium]|jgi:hypothetical protein
MFEVTDRSFWNRPYQTIKEETENRMIGRMKMATGQNFSYNPDANTKEERKLAMAACEQWYQSSIQSKSTTTN